jgi:hypothetical protein
MVGADSHGLPHLEAADDGELDHRLNPGTEIMEELQSIRS